jgi:hypothetical protein
MIHGTVVTQQLNWRDMATLFHVPPLLLSGFRAGLFRPARANPRSKNHALVLHSRGRVSRLITATNTAEPMIDQIIGKFEVPMCTEKSSGSCS